MTVFKAVLWLACGASCLRHVSGHGEPGELYSSIALTRWIFVLDQMLGEFLATQTNLTAGSARYLESYQWAAEDARASNHDMDLTLTGNPLQVYSLFKRLALYGSEVVSLQAHAHAHTYTNHILLHEDGSPVLPSQRDFEGAANGLGRLQRVYDLPITHLLQGRILNTTCSVKLGVSDCVLVANVSRQNGALVTAWEWYRQALLLAPENDTIALIKQEMSSLLQELYDEEEEEEEEKEEKEEKEEEKKKKEKPVQSFLESLPFDIEADEQERDFNRLCRGETFLTEQQQRGLQCHVSSMGSPYLLLRPAKYEQLLRHPELYLYYDVISQNEIEVVQQLSEKALSRAGLQYVDGPSELRVAHVAWLANDTHTVLETLSRRISYMTGLHVHEGEGPDMAGEFLQVCNYGVGGYFIHHHDPLYKNTPENEWPEEQLVSGDRLATFVIYLSEVEAGGKTAFPLVGTAVSPVKGGAVFWYNIHRDGQLDQLALHGGCPILLGDKWIANKWIHEGPNFQRRLCSLDPDF